MKALVVVAVVLLVATQLSNVGAQHCDSDEFECDNGQCVYEGYKCDGDNDCGDYSDERNCSRSCRFYEYECDNGDCVDDGSRCNGFNDCSDGSDEEFCVYFCYDDEFECDSGQCVDEDERCDGNDDCRDGSDEEDCGTSRVVGLAVGISVAVFILFVISPIVLCVAFWFCIHRTAFGAPYRPVSQTVASPDPPATAGVVIDSTTHFSAEATPDAPPPYPAAQYPPQQGYPEQKTHPQVQGYLPLQTYPPPQPYPPQQLNPAQPPQQPHPQTH